eukprot:Selendium_serpulae@DN6445_c1_g1_i5.p1
MKQYHSGFCDTFIASSDMMMITERFSSKMYHPTCLKCRYARTRNVDHLRSTLFLGILMATCFFVPQPAVARFLQGSQSERSSGVVRNEGPDDDTEAYPSAPARHL